MTEYYVQKWTFKKIIYYLLYRIIAKNLPEPYELRTVGVWCHRIRSRLCRVLFRESAKVIGVGKGVDFGNGCNIIMKDHANIGCYAHIGGNHALLTIGRHVMMGYRCTIILQNHKYLDEGYDGYIGKDVLIEDFAWIGHNVIILPGVRIGKHAIIGAGSVVTKNIPDYAIAAGNPAVVKNFRNVKKKQ